MTTSTTNSIQLTFTQCKQIKENGFDLNDAVEQLNAIPEWCHLDSISEIQSIIQCGCASNAHISCFYHDAKVIFTDNTDEIEKVLEEQFCEPVKWDIENESFDQFVSKLLQTAVESVAYGFNEMLEGVA